MDTTASLCNQTNNCPHVSFRRYGVVFMSARDSVGIVTEFCGGGSLEAWLSSPACQLAPFADIVDKALQIARGMRYLHEDAALVHRDLKPVRTAYTYRKQENKKNNLFASSHKCGGARPLTDVVVGGGGATRSVAPTATAATVATPRELCVCASGWVVGRE